ncbi:MAG TPA: carbohydrate ABC transporter permease, partial [Acidimicrobiales bacterium]
AYAFAFLRFPGKRLLFVVFLATLMVPAEVTLVANYETMQRLGWLDSYQALSVPFLATAFGTFLLCQGFRGIPRDLLDASQLDGFGHLAFLRRVALPVTRPVVASFAVVAFLAAWNQYTWPRAVVTEGEWQTVQIGLKTLTATTADQANLAYAAALLAALPVLALLVLLQRHLVRGLTAGAVKG